MIPGKHVFRFFTRLVMIAGLTISLCGPTAQAATEWQLESGNFSMTKWAYLPRISSEKTHYIVTLRASLRDGGPQALTVYALHEDGTRIETLWNYSAQEGTRTVISDFCISDLDADGRPEISAIFNIDGDKQPTWLRLFEWNGKTFSTNPVSSSNIIVDSRSQDRPGQIFFDTFENGKSAQLAILFRGSQRRAYTLSYEGSLEGAVWRTDKEFVSPKFTSGNSILFCQPIRLPQGRSSQIMFYAEDNATTLFSLMALDRSGKSQELASLLAEGKTGGVPTMVSRTSEFGPAQDRLFFSTDRKSLAMIAYTQKSGLQLEALDIQSDFAPESIIQYIPTAQDTFLLLGYNNTFAYTVYRLADNTWNLWENGRTQSSGTRLYGTAFSNESGDHLLTATASRNRIFLEVGDLRLTETAPEKPAENTADAVKIDSDLDTLAVLDKKEADIIPTAPQTEAEAAAIPAPAPTLMQDLKYKVSQYDYVFTPADTFRQNVNVGQMDPGNMQIDWKAPEGATFNIKTGDITWDIREDQLNQQIFDLKIGNKGDTSAYYWNIYINDVPRLLNKEKEFTISLHQPFSLQLQVQDRNTDPEQHFVLKDLAGATISDSGLIEWIPDENQLDVNIFSVLISDGFSVTEEKFMVYVNDPVRIVSRPSTLVLRVNQPWQYQLQVEDRNEPELFQISFTSEAVLTPFIEKIKKFLVADKISVEQEGRKRSYIDVRSNVKSIQIYDNKLYLTLARNNADIKFSEYLSGILDIDYKYIPRYAVRQLKQTQFDMSQTVAGMEINSSGAVTWKPTADDLNYQSVTLRVSDVLSEDTQTLKLYVNSPPRITSPSKAVVLNPGQLLSYKCQVEDLNENPKISYRLSKDSPPAELDYTGQLVWRVKPGQYDYSQLRIIVSDGYDEDEVLLMMYVNDPVKIVPFQPLSAEVEKVWKQDVKVQDRNKSTLYRIVVEDQSVFSNIRAQMALFLSRQAVPVTHPESADGKGREIDVRPAVKALFSYGPILFVEKDPDYSGDADLSDIFAGILERDYNHLPRHKKFHDKNIKFRGLSMPNGMTISDEGSMTWVPTDTQIDTFRIVIEASDAMSADTLSFNLFSNSPPTIVSTAPSLVNIGDSWTYPIEVHDLNKNQAYHINIVDAPDGVILKKSTLIWKPTDRQKGDNTISFIVSDGHQNTAQTFNVYANSAPEILSKPVIVALTGFDYSYQINADDPNGDELRYTAVDIPRYANLDTKTGLVTWQPRSSERGINRFVIDITDSHNKTVRHAYDVQVYEDPAAKKFSLAVFPVMVTVVGVILMAALL